MGRKHFKRIKPLRPWVAGLRDPVVVNELSDVVPFIFLCSKLSILENSWVSPPEDPKAVIVNNSCVRTLYWNCFIFRVLNYVMANFGLKLSLPTTTSRSNLDAGMFYSQFDLLYLRNKFRRRDSCFFIVRLNEYSIKPDKTSVILWLVYVYLRYSCAQLMMSPYCLRHIAWRNILPRSKICKFFNLPCVC